MEKPAQATEVINEEVKHINIEEEEVHLMNNKIASCEATRCLEVTYTLKGTRKGFEIGWWDDPRPSRNVAGLMYRTFIPHTIEELEGGRVVYRCLEATIFFSPDTPNSEEGLFVFTPLTEWAFSFLLSFLHENYEDPEEFWKELADANCTPSGMNVGSTKPRFPKKKS